jgi:methylthioribose-1-phosphate isomerase
MSPASNAPVNRVTERVSTRCEQPVLVKTTQLATNIRPTARHALFRRLIPGVLDVSKIPWEEAFVETRSLERLAQAIEKLEIRGAPAIGVAAALGLAMVAYNSSSENEEELLKELNKAAERLRKWLEEHQKRLEKARDRVEEYVEPPSF